MFGFEQKWGIHTKNWKKLKLEAEAINKHHQAPP